MTSNLISLVLPVYFQADHIDKVVKEYDQILQRLRLQYEMILVVNGAGDESLKKCDNLAKEYANVQVVYIRQSGWGRAVRAGLKECKGDLVCYANSARTSAKDLLLILTYAIAYPDVVIKANRESRDSWQRRIGSWLYNIECRTLFNLPYWDINGTPKIFPRSFNKLLSLTANDDLIDLEFNLICRSENYPVIEVPIFYSKRQGGRSTTNYYSAFKLYLGAYKIWQEKRRQDERKKKT
ncbi:MAG: glycosyltransferase [Candidatus Omnitrophica bacterium]|nr:glycosyltransferase [Candidatus Omnitrophota bacterium]MDD5652698.1 glycosyltransferase [Candidatus Omnitrophota bacterium]